MPFLTSTWHLSVSEDYTRPKILAMLLHNPVPRNSCSGGISLFTRNFLWPILELALQGLQLQCQSCWFFCFCHSSSIRTAHKVPEIRSSITPVQVEIICFLRVALSGPVLKVNMYFLENTSKEE